MHFAVLDNNLDRPEWSFVFESPIEFVRCTDVAAVPAALEALRQWQKQGYWCVGAIAYELAAVFGYSTYATAYEGPLLEFGIFEAPRIVAEQDLFTFLYPHGAPAQVTLSRSGSDTSYDAYCRGFESIQQHLRAGNSYQVNYTLRHVYDIYGAPGDLYWRLRQQQPTEYGAYLQFPSQTLLSRSPELFFEKQGKLLRTKPMKGTAARSPDALKDQTLKETLRADQKQQAENVMIVDLLRNDLGRIALGDTVRVPSLFDVETYETVHQMTSTVMCEVDPDVTLYQVLQALFPCGSITGAPKYRTCEIINDVEQTPRGIYTGAIGYVSPDNAMCFNVPIRTLAITDDRSAILGLGSGVTHDSHVLAEYEETLLKGLFVSETSLQTYRVLDCFYYDPIEGRRHYQDHMARLQATCQELGFPLDMDYLEIRLEEVLAAVGSAVKVRIEVMPTGGLVVEVVSLVSDFVVSQETQRPVVYISQRTPVSTDPKYRHKTTNRDLYDQEFQAYRTTYGAYDVVFFNEHGHLTEGCHHNVVLRFGQEYLTPAVSCGLLDGVGRRHFLQAHAGKVRETTVCREDLLAADDILLVSSIRGIVPVVLVADPR